MTKKQIRDALISQDTTDIFRLCAKMDIDTGNRKLVHEFILANAPNQKVRESSYSLSYGAGDFKNFRDRRKVYKVSAPKMPIAEAVAYAKFQKMGGYMLTNYGKILIKGDDNIYWAHPVYGHSDYNKSVALKNTPKNIRVMSSINKYLGYEKNF